MSRLFVITLLLLSFGQSQVLAELPDYEDLVSVFEAARRKEATLDFARELLEAEKLIAPEVDVLWALDELDMIVERIKTIQTYSDSFDGKIDAITRYFYQEGFWNDFSKYSYDFAGYEPFWNKKQKLVENYSSSFVYKYLRGRKGQCFSMPIVFMIVGEKLGLNVSVASAPSHSFLKVEDPTSGIVYNYEATSGGLKKTSSYIKEYGIAEKAIESGVYLKARSKNEVLLDTVVFYGNSLFFYNKKEKVRTIQKIADEVLKSHPKHLEALLLKANAASMSAKLLRSDLLGQDRNPYGDRRLPSRSSPLHFNIAKSLGPPSRKSPLISSSSSVKVEVGESTAGLFKSLSSKPNEVQNGFSGSRLQKPLRPWHKSLRRAKVDQLKTYIKANNDLFEQAEGLGWNEQSERISDSEIEYARKMLVEQRAMELK